LDETVDAEIGIQLWRRNDCQIVGGCGCIPLEPDQRANVFQMDAMSTIRRLSTIKAAPAEQPMDESSLFVTFVLININIFLPTWFYLCVSQG